VLPLPPPPLAESSEVELDPLAMQLEDERLRKAMEARLCSFKADRAELRGMMTSAADSSEAAVPMPHRARRGRRARGEAARTGRGAAACAGELDAWGSRMCEQPDRSHEDRGDS
jgi:hypothetical protein